MAIWQWLLLALALLWGLQSLGVWFQMRHYSDVMKGITAKYADGFVGAGHVRGRLKKGTIILIVVDRNLIVQRLLQMSGRSVFAKFHRLADFEGKTLGNLRGLANQAKPEMKAAMTQAIDSIERMHANAKAAPTNRLEGIKT